MKDQVTSLVAQGISAASVGANCTREQVKEISEEKYSLIFGSPKALLKIPTEAFFMKNSGKTLTLFLSMKVAASSIPGQWGDQRMPPPVNQSGHKKFNNQFSIHYYSGHTRVVVVIPHKDHRNLYRWLKG